MRISAVNTRLNVKIPAHLAFSIILTLSFLLAFYTIKTAGEVVESAKDSPGFNVQERMKTQLSG